MASTSPAPSGASSNRRMSVDTRPNGPATATVASSSAADQLRDEVADGLHARVHEDHDRCGARRMPALRAAAQPSRVAVHTTSTSLGAAASSVVQGVQAGEGGGLGLRWVVRDHDDLRGGRRVCARAPAWRGRGRPASPWPPGRRTPRPSARSSSREGTDELEPYLTDVALDHVRRCQPLEVVHRPAVHHPPAGGIDLGEQVVGAGPVAGAAGRGTGLGEGDDLGGSDVTGHASEDTASGACRAAQPPVDAAAAPAPMTASDRIHVWASPLHSTEPVRQSSQP